MYKNKIGQKLAIISLLAIGTSAFIETIPSYSNIVLAADKKTDTKSSDSKKTDAKSSDSKSSSSSSSDSSSGTTNPTSIPIKEYEKPDHYWAWLQYWGSWTGNFKGTGHGGSNWGGTSQGCVSTSMAIQAARAGMNVNPSDFPMVNGATLNSYSKGGMTASRDQLSGGGNNPSSSIPLSEVLKQCQKIASAGEYPLIRLDGKVGADNGSDTHTVAYWKAGNGKPLWYDPARQYSGDWATAPVSHVGYLKVTGKGAKKFSENSPSPSGQGASSSNSSSSSKSGDSSGSSDSDSGVGAYKIKPIFNPFYSPAVHYVPADEQDNQSQTNAQVMQTADGMLPTILGSLRVFVGFTAYVYAMLAIIAILVALADLQLGGIFQERILSKSGPMTKALFFPGGNFMGVDDGRGTVVSGKNPALTIVKNGTKHYAALLIILTLVASGSMSWIIGNAIGLIGNLFGLG